MTHAVVIRGTGGRPVIHDLISTDDVGKDKGYGWSRVHDLADDEKGTHNAGKRAM
jgi:hypothetical protein